MKKYLLVIIEKSYNTSNATWVVNAQDGSLPVEVHRGTKLECSAWAKENAKEIIINA